MGKREPLSDGERLLAAALLAEYRERGYSDLEACLLLLDVCARKAREAGSSAVTLAPKVAAYGLERRIRAARQGLFRELFVYEDVTGRPADPPTPEPGVTRGTVNGPPSRS